MMWLDESQLDPAFTRIFYGPTMIAPAFMNNSRLEELIKKHASEILEEGPGFWRFEYEDQLIFVLTDADHNRMRCMSPIVDVDEVDDKEWPEMMSANFDRALDARYCVNNGTVWAAYIHPLEELGSQQFIDGLNQVVNLAGNFGTTYASSNLVFGHE